MNGSCFFMIMMWLLLEIEADREIDTFLDSQFKTVKEKFNKRIRNIRSAEKKNVVEEILGSIKEKPKSVEPIVNFFSLFNATFIKVDDDVFKTSFNQSFILTFYADFPEIKDKVVFLKAVEYNNFGIIAIGLDSGETKIYKMFPNNNKFEKMPSIAAKVVRDGKFFLNKGNLYLILLRQENEEITYTSVYKWSDTYFDEIDSSYTNGAVKIASFAYKTSELIVILQNVSGRKTFSYVYEFRQEKLKKHQLLYTEAPYQVDVLRTGGKNYVIIYETSKENSLYLWNGFGLQEMSTFRWDKNVAKSTIIVYSNSTPLIVRPELEKVLVYGLRGNRVSLEYTRDYIANYSVILDVNKGRDENGHITFIAGLSADHIININATSFRVLHSQMEQEEDGMLLQKCFINLERKIYDHRKGINQIKKPILPILNNFHGDPTKRPKRHDNANFITFPLDETAIESKLVTMRKRLDKLRPFIINQKDDESDLIINEPVTLKSFLSAKKFTAKQLTIKNLNKNKWLPENWLRYKKNQIIETEVIIAKVKTNILMIQPEKDTLFKTIVTNRGNTTFFGNCSIEHVTAKSVDVDKINDIPFENIAVNDKPITGKKIFKNIGTEKAKISSINKKNPGKILKLFREVPLKPKTFDFSSNVTIRDLWVTTIDGINWENFKSSVFKAEEDNTIEGSLVFPKIKTEHLNTLSINNIKPEDLFTKSTDQLIHSTIEFNNIKAANIKVKTINDVSVENVALSNKINHIKTPVIIDEIYVTHDLELKGDVDNTFLFQESRLLGTNKSDFKQIYNGKVTIKGDLYVENLNFDNKTDIQVNGINIKHNFYNDYWSKSRNQTIPGYFEATEGISVPHLDVERLNNISVNNFALNHETTVLSGPLYFENIVVIGNVTLNKSEKNFPDLEYLEKEGIKKNGTFIVKGKKVFENKLRVKNFTTNNLNGINIYDVLTRQHADAINRPHRFKMLTIKGNLHTNLVTNILNDIDLKNLIENAIYINKTHALETLNFKNLTVENLYVKTINGYNLTTFANNLSNILENGMVKTLKIQGNTTIFNLENAHTINNYDLNKLLKNKDEAAADFTGDLKFTKKVRINNLIAPLINNINFPELTQRLWYKNSNQTVKALYTFENLKTTHLYTSKINDKNVTNLVDVTLTVPQEIVTNKTIIFQNTTLKSLRAFGMFPCDIQKAVTDLKNPKTQVWEEVKILGNVSLLDEECHLYKILHKSVGVDKKNYVTAPVYILENVKAENIKTLNNHINGINLKTILDDAVLNFEDHEQVVTGHKTFSEIYASTAQILENADIPLIVTKENDIIVPDFYKIIVTKDKVNNITILGKKTFFTGLQADRFVAKAIMGTTSNNIVSLANITQISKTVFNSFEVKKNLNIKFVKNKDLNNIFQNRLLLNSTKTQITEAVNIFENLAVKDLVTPAINGLPLENVVFDIGNQTIIGQKTFSKNLRVIGQTSIDLINNINISDSFKKSILIDKENVVNGSIVIKKPSKLFGNITTFHINGFPIQEITEVTKKMYRTDEETQIYNIQKQVKSMIHKYLPKSMYLPNELMYIEKSSDIQIAVHNAYDPHITKTKDYVLIHVSGRDASGLCNLPEGCKCPVQQTIEITRSNLSVSFFPNKALQRIYTYEDESITVNFMTNSVSYSTECRNLSLASKEISSLTWRTPETPTQNSTFNYHPFSFTDYISGAEFFTINGKTYGVIAKYYDPVVDSYDLNCTVIKFSNDKRTIQEIQNIPSRGATVLKILLSAQGVILVIGNTKNEYFTEVYRFIEIEEKFELLRSVAYGSTKAVGVVLSIDSFIILANENEQYAPLQVLKYNPYYNNYYHYQFINIEAPVIEMSVFYVGGFGISEAYMCIVTEESYQIYSFQYIDGWKMVLQGTINGLKNLIPIEMGDQLYLMALSTEKSMLLRVVKFGSDEN